MTKTPEPPYLFRIPPDSSRNRFGVPTNCINCRHRRGTACSIYLKQRTCCMTYRLERARKFKEAPQEGDITPQHV